MAKKYKVYEDEEGNVSAHTESYEPKEGEQEIGEVEADSVSDAEKQWKRQSADEGDEAEAESGGGRRKLSEEDKAALKEKEDAQLREEEESKEEFVVMADGDGNFYVEGEESDSDKKKSKKGAEPPPKPEPSEVGTFRARSAKEALEMAQGKRHDPAEGPARGAQTP